MANIDVSGYAFSSKMNELKFKVINSLKKQIYYFICYLALASFQVYLFYSNVSGKPDYLFSFIFILPLAVGFVIAWINLKKAKDIGNNDQEIISLGLAPTFVALAVSICALALAFAVDHGSYSPESGRTVIYSVGIGVVAVLLCVWHLLIRRKLMHMKN